MSVIYQVRIDDRPLATFSSFRSCVSMLNIETKWQAVVKTSFHFTLSIWMEGKPVMSMKGDKFGVTQKFVLRRMVNRLKNLSLPCYQFEVVDTSSGSPQTISQRVYEEKEIVAAMKYTESLEDVDNFLRVTRYDEKSGRGVAKYLKIGTAQHAFGVWL